VKRVALYCMVSAMVGGVLAMALVRGPGLEPVSVAQEPARPLAAVAPFVPATDFTPDE